MINRRKFLKRVGQVLAGVTAAPGLVKAKPKYEASGCPSCPSSSSSAKDICNEALSKVGEYPLGTRKIMADGRVFRDCQTRKKGFIEQNGQIVGYGTGDGWMQTWGPCVVPAKDQHRIFGHVDVVDENLVYLSINV